MPEVLVLGMGGGMRTTRDFGLSKCTEPPTKTGGEGDRDVSVGNGRRELGGK